VCARRSGLWSPRALRAVRAQERPCCFYPPDSSMCPRDCRYPVLLLASLCILFGAGHRSAATHPEINPASRLVEELMLRLKDFPGSGPRVSILTAYHFCRAATSPGVIPQNQCTAKGPSERLLRRLAAHVSRSSRANAAVDGLHATAAIEIVSGNPDAIDRAISALGSANHTAPVLADLAAAHLRRAQVRQSVRDVVIAIDAAARALDSEPENRPALFNLALGLHWFGLENEARATWRQFLSVDSTSAWADEARSHIDALYASAAASLPLSPPWMYGADAPDSALTAYATAAPAQAQSGGQALLERWGVSLLIGDSALSSTLLRQASVLAGVLERQRGDATLGDAVRAIQNHAGDSIRTRLLAGAHSSYTVGRDASRRGDYRIAKNIFSSLASENTDSKILSQWATISLAATLTSQDSIHKAMQFLEALTTQVDTARHPSLAATTYSRIGTILMNKGEHDKAMKAFEQALRLAGRTAERESIGAVQLSLAQTQLKLGHSNAAYEWIYCALRNLHRYHITNFDVLYLTTQLAMDQGLTHAAVRIQSEGLESVTRSGGQSAVVARLSRARALSASGKSTAAIEEVERARFSLESFRPGTSRKKFEAEMLLAEADAVLPHQPRRATILLDSVIRSLPNTDQLSAALALRSEALIAVGEFDRAETDLHRTAGLVKERPSTGGAVAKRVEKLSRRLVMQYVNTGKNIDALEFVETARAASIPQGRLPDQLLLPNPYGQTVIQYLLVGDTLLTWAIVGPGIHLTRRTIPRQRLSQTIAATRLALELRQGDDVLLPNVQLLHEWLIRPVETQIGTAGTPLVIITDGELGSVPFSALYNARRRRYLLEDHALRFARSLNDALADSTRVTGSEEALLMVADPAFDIRAYPDLERLAAARVEADSIEMEYSTANVIRGVDAHQPGLEAALQRANILHFAGHAFYDDMDPAQSFLLLAPFPNVRGSGVWSATEIARLDLRHVRVAVLAACETLRSENRWPNEFQGLAAALRNAGAKGVIGSRWRVSDDLTQALMIRFHREYRASGDGAGALRAAQLSFLRSTDPIHRSVTTWAGFEYMGN
jgi:CHAT domain-containing protein